MDSGNLNYAARESVDSSAVSGGDCDDYGIVSSVSSEA